METTGRDYKFDRAIMADDRFSGRSLFCPVSLRVLFSFKKKRRGFPRRFGRGACQLPVGKRQRALD
jgi:hypothetical protein